MKWHQLDCSKTKVKANKNENNAFLFYYQKGIMLSLEKQGLLTAKQTRKCIMLLEEQNRERE